MKHALLLSLALAVVLIATPVMATTHSVDAGGGGDYLTIQTAINAASSGDTLVVAAGTYREQLKIDSKDLDIVGAGSGTTIIEAVDLVDRTTYTVTKWTASTEDIDPCIGIVGPATVNISDLTVDGRDLGPNHYYGIYFFDADGTVVDCVIEGILYAASPSASSVVSLVATHSETGSTSVTFDGNTIPDFQKGGILVMGTSAHCQLLGNTVIDMPTVDLAGNGIQISYGATGSTYQNVVQGSAYTGDDWAATGILLFESGNITMDGDEVFNCQSGVNYSDWGWVYLAPTQVVFDFSNLNLHDNEWTLGTQLSRDGSDIDIDIIDCIVTDSAGDGIDLFGTGIDPWGGSYYTGWDNGNLTARITGCTITNTTGMDGIWTGDSSGNLTNTSDIIVEDCHFENNASSAVNHGLPETMDADLNYWGDPAGPTTAKGGTIESTMPSPSPFGVEVPRGSNVVEKYATSRAGGGVYGAVSYSPWYAAPPGVSPMPIGTNSSIQAAIDVASPGATISVSAGNYTEQLHITKDDLDIVGAGDDVVTITSPATLPLFFGTNYPIVFIDGATGVDISGVTVDGDGQGNANYKFVGVAFWNAGGSLTDSRVTGIMDTPFSGSQHGVAVYANSNTGGPHTVALDGVEIDDYQKNGTVFSGDGLTIDLDGVTCTGQGPTDVTCQNGIQISDGTGGTLDSCLVQDITYTGEYWGARGILLYDASVVDMTDVTVERCQTGVDFYYTDGSFVSGEIVQPYGDAMYMDAYPPTLRSDGRVPASPVDGVEVLGGRETQTITVSDSRFIGGGALDSWGVSSWVEGGDVASCTMTGCEVTNWDLGVVAYEDGGTSTLTANECVIFDNLSYGYYTNAVGDRAVQNAEYNWWGDATGPYHPTLNSGGLGNEVSDNVDFDPWLLGNIYCDPDPEYLTVAGPTKTVAVKYLGGGGGAVFGYNISIKWDSSVVSTTIGDVVEGNLLSDLGGTFFFPANGTGDEIIVDCALLGSITGATEPGTLFTIDFTGQAVGTSPVDITILNVRDQYNNPLSGFSPIDGTLIIDVVAPVITDVEIFNTTLTHTNDYIKDTDVATVTATVMDDDPAFGIPNIVADLTDLGGGAAVNPVSYLGNVATWNIASVTCTPQDGIAWVYVDATDGIGNPAGQGSDDIIADNTAPTAVTGFDAAPGHQKCDLSWTMGTDTYLDGVVVQRTDNAGDYPLYAAFKGAWPTVTPFYAADHTLGTNVYNGAAAVAVDPVVDRNIYYYQAFCYDIARNYGAADVSGLSADLATNYWLGDVASTLGSGIGFYNGLVNDADINELGGWYHQAPGGAPYTEMDVGPTVHPNYGRLGLPFPDNFVGFEDLMMFAMNYGVVAPRIVPLLSEPVEGQLALSLDEVGSDATGLVELALRLDGNVGDVKGISAVFELDGMEFVSARLSDEMSSPAAKTFLWAGDDQIDLAILGTGVSIGGSGEVARLTFQTTSDESSVDFASATLRGVENELLDADLEGYDSTGDIPAVFKLAQNAPNPFNPMTTIAFNVPHESRVAIRVYDVTGRVVRTLVDGVTEPGRHAAVWDGRNDQRESCGSGVYFCVMETPEYRGSSKMMLLK